MNIRGIKGVEFIHPFLIPIPTYLPTYGVGRYSSKVTKSPELEIRGPGNFPNSPLDQSTFTDFPHNSEELSWNQVLYTRYSPPTKLFPPLPRRKSGTNFKHHAEIYYFLPSYPLKPSLFINPPLSISTHQSSPHPRAQPAMSLYRQWPPKTPAALQPPSLTATADPI